MANLKTLRTRIKSIQSTKKITAAMKMIAAANLKKSQQRLVATRPYAGYMRYMMDNLTHKAIQVADNRLSLMYGRQQSNTVLIIVATSNRGLCGGFNAALIRQTLQTIKKLQADNKQIKLLCLGRRGVDQLSRHYRDCFVDNVINVSTVTHATAKDLGTKLVTMFDDAVFDQCLIIYNQFISPLKQEITCQQLILATTPQDLNRENRQVLNETGAFIPHGGLNINGDQRGNHDDQNADDHDPIMGFDSANDRNLASDRNLTSDHDSVKQAVYEFEPSQQDILKILLLKNLTTQIYTAMLESDASEQGARMAAMESATRNAHDMITALSLKYNRTRQTYITNELIEIISGANAL